MRAESSSKEAILNIAKEMVAKQGIKSINIRSLASQCKLASGTIYNYYKNKDELLLDVIEKIWMDIFHSYLNLNECENFTECIDSLFLHLKNGVKRYPGFLVAHSAVIAGTLRVKAGDEMKHVFEHMKSGLTAVLNRDKSIRDEMFENIDKGDFVQFCLDNLLISVFKGEENCDFLLEIINLILMKKEIEK